MNFGFVSEYFVLFIVAIPLMAAWLALRARERFSRINRLGFGTAHSSPFSYALASASICALLALSLARPYFGKEEITISAPARDVLVLLDTSNSMLTRDVAPDRLSFAKRKILDLIDLLQKDSSGNRIGLMLFTEESHLFCPLTSDYAVLRSFVNAVSSESISEGGSNLKNVIQAAYKSLQDSKAYKPSIILISDGEDTNSSLKDVVDYAHKSSLAINTLGIGTTQGMPIEYSAGKFIRDASGNIVISKLNQSLLSQIAEQTSAIYQHATLGESDLNQILSYNGFLNFSLSKNSKKGSAKQQSDERITTYREIGPWLILGVLALVFYFLATGNRNTIFPILLFALLSIPARGFAQEESPEAETSKQTQNTLPARSDDSTAALTQFDGWLAYKNGDYEKAKAAFESHYKAAPSDTRNLQALASTYYKLGQYAEAEKLYSELASKTQNGREKFEALYNMGNSQFMQQSPQTAIGSYQKALQIKANDEQALANLERAQKALQQMKQQPTPTPNKSEENKDKNKDQNNKEKQNDDKSKQNEQSQSSSQDNSDENQQNQDGQKSSQSSSASSSEGKNQQSQQSSQTSSSSSSQTNNSKEDKESSQSSSQSSAQNSKEEQRSSSSSIPSEAQQSSQSSVTPIQDKPQYGSDSKRQYDPQKLREEQAKSWLNALPDSPVLLYKSNKKNSRPNTQTW